MGHPDSPAHAAKTGDWNLNPETTMEAENWLS